MEAQSIWKVQKPKYEYIIWTPLKDSKNEILHDTKQYSKTIQHLHTIKQNCN